MTAYGIARKHTFCHKGLIDSRTVHFTDTRAPTSGTVWTLECSCLMFSTLSGARTRDFDPWAVRRASLIFISLYGVPPPPPPPSPHAPGRKLLLRQNWCNEIMVVTEEDSDSFVFYSQWAVHLFSLSCFIPEDGWIPSWQLPHTPSVLSSAQSQLVGCVRSIATLTLSLPRVINFKFPLQPHQKYYITQYEELDFS